MECDRMTLIQLIYFYEICKTKNFTAAANNLFVSQPSLSYAIRELEKELDVPLFVRSHKKDVELTEYGKAFLPNVEAAINNIDKAKESVDSMHMPFSGKVKVDFFWSVSMTLIPRLITQCLSDEIHENVKFDFTVHHNWVDLENRLRKGECDLVVSAARMENDCTSKLIAYQQIYALLPWDHPLAERESLSFSEIANEKLVLISPNSNLDYAIKKMIKRSSHPVEISYATDWCSQMLQVAANGGVGLNVDNAINLDMVRRVPVEDESSRLSVYLTWPTNYKLSAATTMVRDELLKYADDGENIITV